MAAGTEDRRAALRDRLIAIAERTVAAHGADAVKARPVAAEAGCSVGAIYNAIGDRDALLAAVNGRTFAALGRFVAGRVGEMETPAARMAEMAVAYRAFAEAHPRLWLALFDASVARAEGVGDWYEGELARLFELIEGPLSALRPDLDDAGRAALARLLFSSVHGTVALAIEERLAAVPKDRLDGMLRLLVSRLVAPDAGT